jgi:hypothetical protein
MMTQPLNMELMRDPIPDVRQPAPAALPDGAAALSLRRSHSQHRMRVTRVTSATSTTASSHNARLNRTLHIAPVLS